MSRLKRAAVAAGCAALSLTVSPTFAQLPHPHPHPVSGGRKEASDRDMQAGLNALQAGAAAIQQGNRAQAISDVQSAKASMTSAAPIYHGHRDYSIHDADAALKELERNGKRSRERSLAHVNKAISEAEAALRTN